MYLSLIGSEDELLYIRVHEEPTKTSLGCFLALLHRRLAGASGAWSFPATRRSAGGHYPICVRPSVPPSESLLELLVAPTVFPPREVQGGHPAEVITRGAAARLAKHAASHKRL